jgi:hypothetical protein
VNLKTAQRYLPCFRPGRPLEGRVLKAVKVADSDPELGAQMKAQVVLDEKMVCVIQSIEPPRELISRLSAFTRGDSSVDGSLRSELRHPAMLPVLLGVVVIIAFLVWEKMETAASFPGKESVARMVAVAQAMNGTELEPTHVQAGQLVDAFYIRGFEGFRVPAQLARLPAVGSRVFKQNGHPVAQVAIDSHNALLYIFRSADFGLQLPEEGRWRVFSQDPWGYALQQSGGLGTVIAFRGTTAEMQEFLSSLEHE